MRAFTATVAAIALVGASAPAARAQDDKVAARRLLREGDRQLQRGDAMRDRGQKERAVAEYERALASYRSAYDAFASPKIFYPIAQVEERLGRLRAAYGHYRTVVQQADDLADNVRAQVEARLAALEQRLVLLSLSVEPADATIVVDGEEMGVAPLDGPVPLLPGDHVVEVSRPGFRAARVTIRGAEGAAVAETVVLLPDEPVVTGGEVVAERGSPARRRPGELEVLVGAGATGGLAIAATVTGILAVARQQDFDDAATPAERASAADSGRALALTTDLLWGAAIAAGAATAYYYFRVYRTGGSGRTGGSDRSDGVPPPAATRRWVAPFAATSGGGLAVGGSF